MAKYVGPIVLYTCTHQMAPLFRSGNAISTISAGRPRFCPPYLAPSFGVTTLEFMEKLYGSWN